MSAVRTAVKRPVTVLMITLGAVLFGAISLGRLPVNLLPDLSYPTITLETRYPGAAPEEVEYLVTRAIEEAVSVIPNKKGIHSSSKAGLSQVVIEFNWGQSMEFAILDVSKKVDLLRLPDEVQKPRILRYDPNQDPILKVHVTSEKMGLRELRHFCEEDLRKRFDSIAGLAAVKVHGGEKEVVEINLEEAALRRFSLSVDQVSARLRQENVNRAGGSLYENEARYLVRTLNEFGSLGEIGKMVVASVEGRPILLEEIARIELGREDRDHIARLAGVESVELAFYKEGDANTVRVARALQQAVADVASRYEGTAKLTTTFEGAAFVESSINEVLSNALLGGAIAVLVLFLFLRDLRSTLVVALSIPVSVFISFFLMLQFSVSLNIMSLGGLALGIGMLVDNSIVVLESIWLRLKQGKSGAQAAEEGGNEVAGAVTASTLTTVVVFLPIVFISGVGGQLFRDLGLTVTFSLVASLVVALTLIPTCSALLSGKTGRVRHDQAVVPSRGAYPAVLRAALRNKGLVLAVLALLLLLGGVVVSRMGMDLIPEMEQGDTFVLLEAPEGTPIETTDRLAVWVESLLKDQPGVSRLHSSVGQFDQGLEQRSGENLAQIQFTLNGPAAAVALERLRQELTQRSDLSFRIGHPSYFSFRTPIELEAHAEDASRLAQLSDRLMAAMKARGGFKDIQSTIAPGSPEVQIRFQRQPMVHFGLSIADVAQMVRDKIQGARPSRFVRQGQDLDMVVRLRPEDRGQLAQLPQLTVGYHQGRGVALSSVAQLETSVGPAQIKRVNGSRCALITAQLDGLSLSAARSRLGQIQEELTREFGPVFREGGQLAELDESRQSVWFMVLLAAFLVYLVMASQFESLLHPFLILLTVPVGLAGGILALALFGQQLNIIAMIGLVMLAGIVVNNAIVLIDMINELYRNEGLPLVEALVQAGARRLRPILMTTSTTVLGLLPMAFGLGDGGEMRAPLALVVIGGLVLSTAVTLLLIPILYQLVTRERVREVRPGEARPGEVLSRDLRQESAEQPAPESALTARGLNS